MFCKNCGQELSSSAKFCPGCGTAIEDDKPKIQSVAPEKGVDDSTLHESAEKNLTDTDSSIENNLDKTEKNAVQAQLTESPSAPEQADNVVVDNANESKQIETAKSENSATDNIKEVLLPQNRKNGKVKFKDLPKKQKIIRISIGAGLLLIALIWMISDGISGANKSGPKEPASVSSEKAVISTIEHDNDTGALFDLTLDEFSDIFSDTAIQMTKEISPDAAINEDWNLKDYWSNKADSQTGYEELSKKKYTIYSAFFEGTHITATVIDNKISHVAVGFDYDNNDLAIVYGSVVYTIFSGLDWREAEEKIFQPVRDGIMDNTMIYKDGALFAITVSTITYDVIPASKAFVKSLENAYDSENPPHIIYYGEDNTQNIDNNADDSYTVEDENSINFFNLIESSIKFGGVDGNGWASIDIEDGMEIQSEEIYFVFEKDSYSYDETYDIKVVKDNKLVTTMALEHDGGNFSSGDQFSVWLTIGGREIDKENDEILTSNGIMLLEYSHNYIVPELSGSYINSAEELTAEDISFFKSQSIDVVNENYASYDVDFIDNVSEKDVTVYYATIKGSAINQQKGKGYVLTATQAKTGSTKFYYITCFTDIYKDSSGELHYNTSFGDYSSYGGSESFSVENIDPNLYCQYFGNYDEEALLADYTFKKIG